MKTENLTNQNHWDDTYEGLALFKPNKFDPINKLIRKYIKKTTEEKSAFEVGCFPGRYLSVLGDLGYSLNGIDLTPRVKTEMPKWLADNRYKVGEFYQEDFLSFPPQNNYDVVCSFGFIEHFTNYEEIIKKHISYVSPNGYLIITTPNFSGRIQKFLHSTFDKENLKIHHLPAMDPFVWKKILEAEGFNILYCGWWGGFDFWAEEKGNSYLGKSIVRLLNMSGKILRFLPISSQLFSPYSVIVAKR